MSTYIMLSGCDDSTVIDLELTDTELDLVNRICALSEAKSSSGCQPVMKVLTQREVVALNDE